MSQRTLHHYKYPVRTTSSRRPDKAFPTTPFRLLDLPFSIRRRIYIFAGLFSGFKIHLNYEPPDEEQELWDETREPFCTQMLDTLNIEEISQQDVISPWSEQLCHFIGGPFPYPRIMLDREIWRPFDDDSPDIRLKAPIFNHPEKLALPFQLLYVSHRVSMDAKEIFWSENHFSVSRSDIGGLSAIMLLPKLAFRFMTALSIRLNYWGNKHDWQDGARHGHPGFNCHPGCPPYGFECKIGVDTNAEFSSIFERKLAKRRERYYEQEQRVLLKEWKNLCGLLSKFTTPGKLRLWLFCDVANEEGAKLILNPLSQLPLLLDCGIRLGFKPDMKLQHLAMRTAVRLKSLEPSNNSKISFLDLPYELQTGILEYADVICTEELEWSLDKSFQSTFSPKRPKDDTLNGCCGFCFNEESICYCSSKHSSYSSTCICYRFPSELFLVSRDVRSLVVSMFFSKNKIVIIGNRKSTTTTGLYKYITEFPVEARQYLRHINWAPQMSLTKTHYGEWLRVIDFCADQLNISKLTFTIDMSAGDQANHISGRWSHQYGFGYGSHQNGFGYDYDRWPPQQAEELQIEEWNTSLRMAKAMKRYRGWKDVFFHLSEQPRSSWLTNRKRSEAFLEKTIQGRNYDSLSRGKVYRECSCSITWHDALIARHADYWEEKHQDDSDYLFAGPETVRHG